MPTFEFISGNTHKTVECASGSYTLGSGSDATLKIQSRKVEPIHAELKVTDDGKSYLTDVSSKNGVWIGDFQLEPRSSYEIKEEHHYEMGTVKMRLFQRKQTQAAPEAEIKPQVDQVAKAESTAQRITKENLNEVMSQEQTSNQNVFLDPAVVLFMDGIHSKTLAYLDLHKRAVLHSMSPEELRREAYDAVRAVLAKEKDPGLGLSLEEMIEPIVAEAVGLGPLETLLLDDDISEIMVNRHDQIYVEKSGKLTLHDTRFSNPESLLSIIERIVTPLGRRIDEGVPMVDARLRDGSRVNAIIPPLALNGATLTIRKFAKYRMEMDDLLKKGTLSPPMANFLTMAIKYRMNMIVSGGTGSGKTTTLNILSNDIPSTERIVTVEDSAELQLSQDHVISLESRPANVEGKGEVTIRDLVKNCLRMRPDRIVVGECRGGEALDMLQAMNTGHDGSLTTGHANSPRDLLARLEVMVLMSGVDLPVRAIREQISSAVDIVLQQARFSDGTRRITSIAAVDGMEGDVILLQTLFEYEQTGIAEDGAVIGEFRATGEIPKFYEKLERSGVKVDLSIFGAKTKVNNNDW